MIFKVPDYAIIDRNDAFPYLEIGLEVLAVQRVSKAQAWQRTGRAGREDSGICYRLYTEDEFEKFDKMTVPEIQRWERVVVKLLISKNCEVWTDSFSFQSELPVYYYLPPLLS